MNQLQFLVWFFLNISVASSQILQGIILNEDDLEVLEAVDDRVLLDDEGVGSSAGGATHHSLFPSLPNGTRPECDDIAIIGAGIAGSYLAWRLRHSNLSISVYEYASRVGGRLYTSHINHVPHFNAELGAMRFHIPSHQLLNKTIHSLGLTPIPFPLGYGASNHTQMYLRGVHLRYDELGKSSNTPYHLKPSERVPYDQLKWEIFVNYTDYNNYPHRSPFLLKTLDGVPLYQQSIQAVFAKYVSTDSMRYIEDVNSFLSDFGTTNAAYALPARDPITPGESSMNLHTVKEGMNNIPKRLLSQFLQASKRHHLYLKHDLKSINKHNHNYTLGFDHHKNPAAQNQCAKKIILAVNRLTLERLNWNVLKRHHFHDLITKSVRDAHAVKFFIAYDHPWWRKSKYYDPFVISDTPLHRTYDFGTIQGTNISVLDAVYSDNDVSLWEELIKRGPKYFGNSIHGVSNETVRVLHRYLSEIYDIDYDTIPYPIGGVIGVWDAYPIGGAWQEWLPGYIMPDVEKQMVKPSATDEVYIASNAFNSKSLSFWCESALEAAELVLEKLNVTHFLH